MMRRSTYRHDPVPAYITYSEPWVLIVDDEELLCREIVEFLRARGLPANYETDPATAVGVIESERPRAILVDINMKGLNGRRVVEIAQNVGFRGSTLLMSGDLDAVRAANFERVNVLHILTKPIPLPILERYLRALLQR
jgi:DNA-binding NtrC family response regulator